MKILISTLLASIFIPSIAFANSHQCALSIGLYELGAPRSSKKFGKFIPINYPTPHQKLLGYTGKNVGIHGPLQSLRWLGTLNTWFDWTRGCIAVSNNEDIGFITTWVNKHPRTQVLIQ